MSERWPALMSAQLAAEYLDMSARSLKRLQAAGRIKPVTIRDGSFLRFRRSDLDSFIEELPFGSGTCAANEKRVAVVMLARQAKAAARKGSSEKAPAGNDSAETSMDKPKTTGKKTPKREKESDNAN